MRTVIYVAGGIALLIVLVIGGGIGWFTNKVNQVATTKVDVGNQDSIDTFKAKFESGCTTFATKGIDASDYQQIALIKQVCACDGKALVAIMKRHQDMTVLQLGKMVLDRSPEVTREFDSCAQAYGINVRPN